MKHTLLDMTQEVLSSMDGDEVNSIGDTVESQQVSLILRAVFRDLMAHGDLNEHFGLVNLDATDAATPTLMRKPANVDYIDTLTYNIQKSNESVPNWKEIKQLEPNEFLEYIRGYDLSDTSVSSYSLSFKGFATDIYFKNNEGPRFWTSFDDNQIIFDQFDVGVDAMLQSNKSSAYAKIIPVWLMEDTFIPELDDAQFPLLINEAKAQAWAEMKQTTNAKAEKRARQGWIRLERTKQNLPGSDSTWKKNTPNFGRHR